MKKDTVNVKFTLEMIIFGLVYWGMSFIKNSTFTYISFGLLILYLFFDLYSSVQDKADKRTYTFYSSKKNKFSKVVALAVGSLTFTIAIFSIILTGSFSYHALIGFVLGSWIIVNGLFELPKRYE